MKRIPLKKLKSVDPNDLAGLAQTQLGYSPDMVKQIVLPNGEQAIQPRKSDGFLNRAMSFRNGRWCSFDLRNGVWCERHWRNGQWSYPPIGKAIRARPVKNLPSDGDG